MELPAELQSFISTNVGWEYNQIRGAARRCSNISKAEYMGTYFPRSFVESYEIFELLNENKAISYTLSRKDKLNFLDIGSGTGGNFLGYLWFRKDNDYLRINFPSGIYLRSYDKDGDGLNIQKSIIEKFFPNYVSAEYRIKDFESRCSAIEYLNNDLSCTSKKFDVIMCSKFINEFYASEEDYNRNRGFYGSLVRLLSDYLSTDGLLIISDITTPCFDGSSQWLPEVMSAEINTALRTIGGKLSIVQPLSCAFFREKCAEPNRCFIQSCFTVRHSRLPEGKCFDRSYICVKVLCKASFAKIVLKGEQYVPNFVIARKQDGNINTCSDRGQWAISCTNDCPQESGNYKDAFGWSS